MVVGVQSEHASGGNGDFTSEQEQYGKLVMARFYGPTANWNLAIAIIIILIAQVIFLSFFIYTAIISKPDFYSKLFGFGLLICIICVILFIGMKILNSLKDNPTYRKFEIAGKLDYDLYENGMVVKAFATNIPGHLVTKFIPFRNISEIYLLNNKDNIEPIINIIKEHGQKTDSKQKGFGTIDDNTEKWIQRNIWLLIDGEPFAMERDQFKDLYSFKKYIENKVKVVN